MVGRGGPISAHYPPAAVFLIETVSATPLPLSESESSEVTDKKKIADHPPRTDSKQSMERVSVKNSVVFTLGIMPVGPSFIKVRGHDSVVLGQDVRAEGGETAVRSTFFWCFLSSKAIELG